MNMINRSAASIDQPCKSSINTEAACMSMVRARHVKHNNHLHLYAKHGRVSLKVELCMIRSPADNAMYRPHLVVDCSVVQRTA